MAGNAGRAQTMRQCFNDELVMVGRCRSELKSDLVSWGPYPLGIDPVGSMQSRGWPWVSHSEAGIVTAAIGGGGQGEGGG